MLQYLKMTKRRTKKDKIIAQLRRQLKTNNKDTFPRPDVLAVEESVVDRVETQQEKDIESYTARQESYSLFSYDSALIRKDLLRTLLWASVAFGIEIGLYIIWR
jgi:hypothetical protein